MARMFICRESSSAGALGSTTVPIQPLVLKVYHLSLLPSRVGEVPRPGAIMVGPVTATLAHLVGSDTVGGDPH